MHHADRKHVTATISHLCPSLLIDRSKLYSMVFPTVTVVLGRRLLLTIGMERPKVVTQM